jgi:hypothetical protein
MNKWRAQRFKHDAEAIENFTYELLTSVVVSLEETRSVTNGEAERIAKAMKKAFLQKILEMYSVF